MQGGILGKYIAQMILEAKAERRGTLLPDFFRPIHRVPWSAFLHSGVSTCSWISGRSWCKTRRMENPNLVAAYNKYRDKIFTVFGVSPDQAKKPGISAIKMDGLNWTQVSDLKRMGNAVCMVPDRSIPQFPARPEEN